MAFIPSGLGTLAYGDPLRGTRSYISDLDITPPTGIEIQFFSLSGEFVGLVGTTFDNSNLVNLTLEERRIGGLNKFSFTISRTVNIPFYNRMETRFYIDSVLWYVGELDFRPDQDKREERYEYIGRGYIGYLKDIKIDKLYQNKTIKEIIVDLIENELDETPINYNPDLINPPNITITKIEFKNKTIDKAMKSLLEIANFDYNSEQYTYGIDTVKQFYFEKIPTDIETGLFEGYQYQNPDVKETTNEIVNKIDIFRAQEDSQQVEFITSVSDSDSIELYGEKYETMTISDFVDTNTAIKIAEAKIEHKKDPIVTAEIKDLVTEANPYPIRFYYLNNKVNDYIKLIDEFNNLNDWTRNIVNTTVTVETNKVLSGKKAFKCVLASGSDGEYIEFELDETLYYPTALILWISQNPAGDTLAIRVFDEDGNFIDLGSGLYELEDGTGFYELEDESGFYDLELGTIDIDIVDDYQKRRFDATGIENIKKIRIIFKRSTNFTIYLDRLEIETNTYLQRELILDKIKYTMDKNRTLADCTFGDEIDNIIEDIKKIDDKNRNIYDIFTKS
jgi:hypothetical protein